MENPKFRKDVKEWFAVTCPICGFRYPMKKFASPKEPIAYPIQIVTGGGRAQGFRTLEYLPWSTLKTLVQTDAGKSLANLYARLAASYDSFYETLGWHSPRMRALLKAMQGCYTDSYRRSPFENYHLTFGKSNSADIVEAYTDADGSRAYTPNLTDIQLGGPRIE
jgi:hypothetical protein